MKLRKTQRGRALLVTACAAFAIGSGVAVAGSQNYNPEHVLNAFKHPDGSVGIIAHRGIVGNGCPENSTCSIVATENNGIEAIELDVKQSSDGTPWLFHDLNVGRVAWRSGFDIYTGTGWNPDVRSLGNQSLTDLTLRDKNFNRTNYNAVNLAEALNTVQFSAPNVLVVLDLKTLDAVSRAADLAIARGMKNKVVLKFSASLLAGSPWSISEYTKGVAFAPTIYAGDMDGIVGQYKDNSCGAWGGAYNLCLVESWITQASDVNNFAWVEVGNKNPQQGDPTYPLVQNRVNGHKAIGQFVPVKEYRQNYNDGRWYIKSDGTCCASLNDYLTSTVHFGHEWVDNRPDVSLQVRTGFNSIITDDPWAAISAAAQYNKRDTSKYF